MKPVLTRILKAFEVLLELKYLLSFEEIYKKDENTYYIAYVLTKKEMEIAMYLNLLKD